MSSIVPGRVARSAGVIIALFALVITANTGAGALANPGIVIPAGIDIFVTDDAALDFNGDSGITIPADFFDPGSQSPSGQVRLAGSSLSPTLGDTDTIVERVSDVIVPLEGAATVQIEMISMNLSSVDPLTVAYSDGRTEQWHVNMAPSPFTGSAGIMGLEQSSSGNTFSMFVNMFPVLTFTREGDSMVREYDWTQQSMSVPPINLSGGGAWSQICDDALQGSDADFGTTTPGFCPGGDDLDAFSFSGQEFNTLMHRTTLTFGPLDTDGDGVVDDFDLCGDTTVGEPVDQNGCADSQVDNDGDGVCNPEAPSSGPSGCIGQDECPDTPTGEEADERGCSVSQLSNIIIEKEGDPEGPGVFTFTGDLGRFQLDVDDATPTVGKSILFFGLKPGFYRVTEIDHPEGWGPESVRCSPLGLNSTRFDPETGAFTAGIVIEAGETLTCTFVNSKVGSIEIVKRTIFAPSDTQFEFASAILGDFVLDTDPDTPTPDSKIFTDLQPGTYNVAELVPDGWVGSASCFDRDLGTQTVQNAAFIDLDPGERVRCAFVNSRRGVLTVPIDVKPDSDSNTINPDSKGKVTVAVLSTPVFFPSRSINPRTATFGATGNEDSMSHFGIDDVNSDGIEDLVFHFDIPETGIEPGTDKGILKADGFFGGRYEGESPITTVPR